MSRRITLALAACCLSLATVAAGQTRATTADLGGTIVDQSSAVLPGATVTAQNVDTNQARSAMTDERGHFLHSGAAARHLYGARRAAGISRPGRSKPSC